jgi:lysophospholipase L1-like esterase
VKTGFSISLLVTLLFGTAAYAAAPVRILQIGDSITGQHEARQFLYDRLSADGVSFVFVGSQGWEPLWHEGYGGYTIGPDSSAPGNLFDHIGPWLAAARPDIITVLAGNNDYNGKPGVDPLTAPARMEALLNIIHVHAPKATIIVSSVLKIAWVDDYAAPLNRALPAIVKRQQAAGHHVYFADLNTEVDLVKGAMPYDQPGGDYLDGTHLSTSGARKLADGWSAHLKPFLTASAPAADISRK